MHQYIPLIKVIIQNSYWDLQLVYKKNEYDILSDIIKNNERHY